MFYWHFEVSSKCSLACPRCPRTEKPGMYKVTELDLQFFKSFMTSDILKQTTNILFCGGQGDPIYCKELLDIIEYIKTENSTISIRLVTNGSYKTKTWWSKLASMLNEEDVVVFSVDGWDNESNNMYRVNSKFDSIIDGVNTLSSLNDKVKIMWSTIIFSFNEDKLDDIQQVAEEAGATHFQIVQSSLFGSKVSSYIDKDLGYDPLEPKYTSKYRHSDRGLIVDLKNKPDPETERSKKHIVNTNLLYEKFENEYDDFLPACLINERGLYVDAEGILYPCSWVSHPFDEHENEHKKISFKQSLFVKHKQDFSLYEHDLNTILNSESWNKLHKSFSDPKKRFIECGKKCNKKATLARLERVLNLKMHEKNIVNNTVEKYTRN